MQNILTSIERAKELTIKRVMLIQEEKQISAQLRAKNHEIYDVEKELEEIEENIVRSIREEIQCQK